MKKNHFLLVLLGTLLTAVLLAGCPAKKSETPSSSSSQTTTSQTSSTQTQPSDSTASSSNTAASSTEEQIAFASMDIEAIFEGDFSSIIGTWADSQGHTLVFNDLGLVSEDAILTENPHTIVDGVLEVGVASKQGQGGFALLMVPKGTILSESNFETGSDTTDSSRDRMFGTQQKFASSEVLNPYYRITPSSLNGQNLLTNNNTGVTLESGQSTIDYANSVLGDRSWNVIESNYNRTESIPFELLQGDNGSLYRVYRNGVIVSEKKHVVVYAP